MNDKNLKTINTNTEDKERREHQGDQKSKRTGGNGEGATMYRVVITEEANMALEEIVAKVGVGFEAGTVTKSDIANFVFQNLPRYFSDADTKALRSLHFDDKKVLSTILKNENDLPEEIKKAIRQHYGVSEKTQKRSSKTPSELSTFPSVEKSKPKDSVA